MVHKNLLLTILVLFSLFFSQCSSDPVEKDLLNYINIEIPKLAALESEAIDAYSSVSGEKYTDDAAMYSKIKEVVLPKYSEFSTKLKAIVPATNEVKGIHGKYLKAAEDQLEAFKLILEAIEKQDPNEIALANNDLGKAVQLLTDWKIDLKNLCKNHNVDLEEDKK